MFKEQRAVTEKEGAALLPIKPSTSLSVCQQPECVEAPSVNGGQ